MAGLAVFTPDQGAQIHARALHVLEHTGMRTPVPSTRWGRAAITWPGPTRARVT